MREGRYWLRCLAAAFETAMWITSDPHRRLLSLCAGQSGLRWIEIFGPRSDSTNSFEIKRALFIWSDDLIVDAFRHDGGSLVAGEASKYLLPFLGGNSLFVLDGEYHREERKRYAVEMQAFEQTLVNESLVLTLGQYRARSPHIPLVSMLHDASLNASLRTILPSLSEIRHSRLFSAFSSLVKSMSRVGLFFPPKLASRIPGNSVKNALDAVELIRSELYNELSLQKNESNLIVCEDAKKNIESTIDRIVTLIVGSFESTATAAAWTIVELLKNSSANALFNGKKEFSSPDEKKLIHMACLETLRLHPPTPIIIRRCISSIQLGGYNVMPGEYIVFSIAAAHLSAAHFEEPKRFDPGRFKSSTSNRNFPFYPFGGGIRRCIGQGVALKNIEALVHSTLINGPWKISGAISPTVRNITLAPSSNLKITMLRSTP